MLIRLGERSPDPPDVLCDNSALSRGPFVHQGKGLSVPEGHETVMLTGTSALQSFGKQGLPSLGSKETLELTLSHLAGLYCTACTVRVMFTEEPQAAARPEVSKSAVNEMSKQGTKGK